MRGQLPAYGVRCVVGEQRRTSRDDGLAESILGRVTEDEFQMFLCFGIDLFQLPTPPETFGALLQAVSAFDEVEHTDKHDLDLSRYPEPVSAAAHAVEVSGGADKPAARVALTWEREMLEKLAELRGLTEEDVSRITTENGLRLYRIK